MRFERFLIGFLWLLAILLAALWFFDTMFSFDLFSQTHWSYLSELQLAGKVGQNFYISAAVFIVIGLVGLYLLIVPWYRRIKLVESNSGQNIDIRLNDIEKKSTLTRKSQPSTLDFTRPPTLNLNSVFIPPRRDNFQNKNTTNTSLENKSSVWLPSPSIEVVQNIKNILGQVGFILRDSPTIGGIRPDIFGIGSDEALVIGIVCSSHGEIIASEGGDSLWKSNGNTFKSPVWSITGVIQKLEALFLEVLEPELTVNILPFVFVDGKIINKESVQNIWDALGVKVFDDISTLSDFINKMSPRKLEESEREDFEAFSDFINTVSQHFNNGSN